MNYEPDGHLCILVSFSYASTHTLKLNMDFSFRTFHCFSSIHQAIAGSITFIFYMPTIAV